MEYELAEQLKDAGFPNSEFWEDVRGVMCVDTIHGYKTVPTLDELIEACAVDGFALFGPNKGFHALTPMPDGRHTYEQEKSVITNWKAVYRDAELVASGNTPQEAVARLWLALNKAAVPSGASVTSGGD